MNGRCHRNLGDFKGNRTSRTHNVNQLTYKKATAFEALLGYLNLSGDAEREKEIIQRTFEIIESSDIAVDRGNRK